jgi:hypothetical protein
VIRIPGPVSPDAFRPVASEAFMEYDRDKVDEAVLALLYLTSSRGPFGTRAWKGLDSETMDRLHGKGYIGDPKTKGPTLSLTEAGGKLSKELFFRWFDAKE